MSDRRKLKIIPAAAPRAVPDAEVLAFAILRDGDRGEPDVTLNPRSEIYSHRAEIEAFVTHAMSGGGEAALDVLLAEIGTAIAADRGLGGLAENLFWSPPETSVLAIEGAAPILHRPHYRHHRVPGRRSADRVTVLRLDDPGSL